MSPLSTTLHLLDTQSLCGCQNSASVKKVVVEHYGHCLSPFEGYRSAATLSRTAFLRPAASLDRNPNGKGLGDHRAPLSSYKKRPQDAHSALMVASKRRLT